MSTLLFTGFIFWNCSSVYNSGLESLLTDYLILLKSIRTCSLGM